MKKIIFLLLLIISCIQSQGQNLAKSTFKIGTKRNTIEMVKNTRVEKSLSLKNYLITRHEYKKSSKDKFIPKLTIDLLDGKGIHLFSISNMGFIPNINIGARITAKIKVTI